MLRRVLLALLLVLATAQAGASADISIGCLPGSAQMTLAQARALPDRAWRRADPSAPFNDLARAEWCRLNVSSADPLGAVVRFKVASVVIAPVATLYWPDATSEKQSTQVGVQTRSFGRSRHPAVLVEAKNLNRPILLRFMTRNGPRGSLEAWELPDYVAQTRDEQSFQVAVLASMGVLGLMASLFAYQLGRRVLVYLCLWVVAVIVLRVMESGLFTAWVAMEENTRRVLHAISLTVAIVSSVIFSDRYLGLGVQFPRISKLLMVSAGALSVLGLLVAIQMSNPLRDSYNLLIIVQFLLIAGCALVLFARGDEMARFFMLGWSPVLITSVMRTSYFLFDKPLPGWLDPLWQLTLLFAIFVLLLVTARAARDAEREMLVVRRAANHDPLTGLPNRTLLFNALREGIENARKTKTSFALLFLDLDHFKRVNDVHGHDVGDRGLEHFSQVIQTRLRVSDMLARLGGEEFVVLLPGANLEQAGRVSDDLRTALAGMPLLLDESICPMTVSIGVAELRASDDAESLLKRADAAVYRAKADGRNRTVLETALAAS